MRARKRFGQNFLKDRHIIARIVDAIDAQPGEPVIEIGPGHGALTDELLRQGPALSVVEIDRDLVAELRLRHPGLNIIESDVLKIDLASLGTSRPVKVVGNLPYNISTPLLFRLLQSELNISVMTFMLQLEVVERMTAAPGNGTYGRLSVMCQYYCDAIKLFDVPPSAFVPRPAVMSAIVQLTPRAPETAATDPAGFADIVTRAFNQRRKTVRNAWRNLVSPEELLQLGIDPGARPETLALDDFVRCANLVAAR